MVGFLIGAVVIAVGLMILSYLPLGVEVDSPWKALAAGIVLGLLQGTARLVPGWATLPFKVLTLGLFSLIVSTILFGLAAWLVEGFRLKNGIWSALLGAIFIGIFQSIVLGVLDKFMPGLI
ncbi:MAG: phage holin family protein [Oscillatoriales cyanobacterium]|nr:MAG: phage holin family protein [Oscillatoriales cyanobacterium]